MASYDFLVISPQMFHFVALFSCFVFLLSFHNIYKLRKFLGDECAMNTGYNEVAESNNIIIIYPQAIDRPALGNPHGCWDW